MKPGRLGFVLALTAMWAAGWGLAADLQAQGGGAGTGGLARLSQERRLAGNWRRVLMIGAHPDDEDTELLTILARGQGIDVAYLSLTRGEGGQNLIGPELGAALGVLRTEELAAARRIDGGRQFFTRAYDFGFSKTEEETLRFWNRDSILKDMVRIIRRFRPQIVVSVWSGTPVDGHGHHQASGTLSLEAFHAAGDATRFPELLTTEHLGPWQPAKLYRTFGRGLGGLATLTFDGGVIDPAVGLSLHQIAARSRSQHRSQNQGNLEELGPSHVALQLAERVPGITGPDDSLFAGVPPESPPALDSHLAEGRLIEAGVVLDVTTDDAEVTPGEVMAITLRAWNAGHDTIGVVFGMEPHPGFASRGDQCPQHVQPIAPRTIFSCKYITTVWDTAAPSAPYYLDKPRDGAMLQWSGPPELWGEPSEPPLSARFAVTLGPGGEGELVVRREVQARFRDPVLGEVRRPVNIVQPITVDLEPNRLLWATGVRTRTFSVSLEHLSRDTTDATVSLSTPPGWMVSAPQHVYFRRKGERATATFTVTAPLPTPQGPQRIGARVVTGHETLTSGLYRIRYPHVRDRNLVTAAESRVVVADVKFPRLTAIGYVRGGGDGVPEAMLNAGLPVTLLSGDALERGPLDHFQVIVIGPRAYEADESLVRANTRLMRWLAAGGTLIVQYQQTPYVRGGFAPKPLNIVSPTQSRVTDETAPVTMLAKNHQVLRWPNQINQSDFDGWIQERGLDFPPSFDPAWTPILEMHDPGDIPRNGGLLVARVGKGTAVYTGLAFHRQLPAMVPGAWRLWANLLGAGQVSPVGTAR